MNDSELITVITEQRGKIQMTTPVEQIIGRGHALRVRRRIPGLAGALALAAAAALALATLLPAHHQPRQHPGAQLAAWTVVKRADGTIQVTVRQLRDPAGLQRTLRADGVPASVTFFGRRPQACQPYAGGHDQISKVFGLYGRPLVIHPSALPSGTGVELNPLHYRPGAPVTLAFGLVQASARCTGN
jgi:hypothetical protein